MAVDNFKSLYSLENDVFKVYLTYAILVVFKMMFLSFYTSFTRISNKRCFTDITATRVPLFEVMLRSIVLEITVNTTWYLRETENKEDFGWTYPEEKATEKIANMKKDERVNRILRCHLNDLENIPAFLIVGLLFVAINPSLYAATMHYRIFAAARYFHCVAYLLPLPQPSRALGFGTGAFVTISMGVQILRTVAQF